MTPEQFNELPLDARQYIEQQKTCLSCGKANDLDAHYRNYLAMKNDNLFSLRTGAVNYKDGKGKTGILYPIHPNDQDETIKEKLGQALAVYAVAPEKFSNFSEEKIKKILGIKDVDKTAKKLTPAAAPAGTPTDKNGKPLTGAPLKAAQEKADAAAKLEADAKAQAAETARLAESTGQGSETDKDKDPLQE